MNDSCYLHPITPFFPGIRSFLATELYASLAQLFAPVSFGADKPV